MKSKHPSVSGGQITVFLVVFLLGSTPMIGLGGDAGQDSWLALGCAALAGLILLFVYRVLQNRAPEADLVGLYRLHFGRLLGAVLGILQALLFAWESMRGVRDFGELTSITLLPQTPMWVLLLLMAGLAVYTVVQGIESFFRINQVLLPVLAACCIMLMIVLLASGQMDGSRLRPVLEDGLGPVMRTAFMNQLEVPFGGVIILLMFWNYAKASVSAGPAAVAAYSGTSLFLIAMSMIIMMALGPELSGLAALPVLEAAEEVRLDSIFAVIMYIGIYIKATSFLLGAVLAMRAACGWPLRAGALALVPLIYVASLVEAGLGSGGGSLDAVLSQGILPIYEIGIPLLMLVMGAGWVKRKAQGQNQENNQASAPQSPPGSAPEKSKPGGAPADEPTGAQLNPSPQPGGST